MVPKMFQYINLYRKVYSSKCVYLSIVYGQKFYLESKISCSIGDDVFVRNLQLYGRMNPLRAVVRVPIRLNGRLVTFMFGWDVRSSCSA